MGDTIRFTSYVGLVSNGQIRFVTDETGSTTMGEKAMMFSAADAREMVCRLARDGSRSAVVIAAPQHNIGSTLYNPNDEIAFSDDEIKALARKGFERWTRGKVDRLYIGAESFGLRDRGKGGYELNGERIDYYTGVQLERSRTYVDCLTGIVHSDSAIARECAEGVLAAVLRERTTENPVA